MQVIVLLSNEYLSAYDGEKNWFLKCVSEAKKRGNTVIVTNEVFKTRIDEILDGCSERMYSGFIMDKVSKSDINDLPICYIPDDYFKKIRNKSKSRTDELFELNDNRYYELEEYIISFIDNELKNSSDDSVEIIYNYMHVFESVRYLSKYYNCLLVPFIFSAVRKMHGYTTTLYMAHIDKLLYGSSQAEELYQSFYPERITFPLFDNREILSLIGKTQNFCLFPMIDFDGQNEMGIIGEGFRVLPSTFCIERITDDDLYYECNKYYKPNEIVSRLHPMQIDQSGFGRQHMKNDPAPFLLSCKRVTTVRSQMIVKAIMWNRGLCSLSMLNPCTFMFEKDFKGVHKLGKKELNFVVLCYLVPDGLMFDKDYWLWRSLKPSANDVFAKHITEILNDMGLNDRLLNSNERLKTILLNRGCNEKSIKRFLQDYTYSEHINYTYLSSKASVYCKNEKTDDIFCLNNFLHDCILSTFEIENKNADKVELFLTNDIDGYISLESVCKNNTTIDVNNSVKYSSKGECNLTIKSSDIGNSIIVVKWKIHNRL